MRGRKADRVPLLTWPTEFGSSARKPAILFGMVFFSAAAVFFVARFVISLGARDLLGTILYAGGALVSVSFVAACVSVRNTRHETLPRRIDHSRSGLSLPMARPFTVALIVLLISGGVFSAAYAVMLLTRDHGADAGRVRDILIGLALVAVAAVAAWLACVYVSMLRGPCRLVVGYEGIELDNGSVRQTIAWEFVRAIEPGLNYDNPALIVSPESPDSLITLKSSFIVRRFNKRYLRQMIIDIHFFRVDPALLYYLILFYWRNPADRVELRGDAAIERMRSGNLSG